MKVFALLLSFLLYTSCSTPFGLHDFDGFLVGWGHPAVEFSSYGEEKVNEPVQEELALTHDPRIPYDFSFIECIDWESYRPKIKEAEPEPVQETAVEDVQPIETTQEDESLTGDDIVLLACMFMFLLIVMIGSVTMVRRRRD